MTLDTTTATGLLQEAQDVLRRRKQIPSATYRLQFNRTFTFQDARALAGYFQALGISHCYASPYFKARADSMHGYDIADHNALNPSIGDEADYNAWVAELHAHGLGQVLDTVPNHMGIGEQNNQWWQDVLENGPSSPYASFFDIDWTPIKPELENSVLLPILGDQYGRVLENQELRLAYADGAFTLHYWETTLPVAPRTYALVLQPVLEHLTGVLAPDDEHILELQSIITALSHLPPRTETDPARIAERHREREIIKRRLQTLTEQSAQVQTAVEQVVVEFNGIPGDSTSFNRLDELIRAQIYRLSYWRVAAEEINYRRFFDVNDLAAIRMERPEVFAFTHRLIMRLLSEGAVDGLRVDHPDGLWDPAGYFLQLQKAYQIEHCRRMFLAENPDGEAEWPALEAALGEQFDALAQDDPASPDLRLLPLYVEKILSRGEQLPAGWTVEGTSGYDFLNLVNGLFVDGANEKAFNELYAAFIRTKINFADLVYQQKKLTMRVSLASEINVLAHMLDRISERSRYFRDFTLNSLTDAIREVIACFSVYRTYITGHEGGIDKRDQAAIEGAISRAKRRNPATDQSIFEFIRRMLLLEYPVVFDEEARQAQLEWVMKFQQCTGPVMAKGLEDTAFYIYNRLISLNEVGGEPQHFGIPVAAFHRQNVERVRRWPHAMLTTSTHDTKRSEDVRRARLNRWSRLNRRKKPVVDGQPVPDRNEEYLLYQTLAGTWPFETMSAAEHAVYVDRIVAYMLKALREAKVNTSWVNPNTAYDQAVETFVRTILDPAPANEFLGDLGAWSGMLNSLAQTLIKLTAPGVPDIYQGNELWDLSLVDPDNRRPVDYASRARMLREMQKRSARAGSELPALIEELVADRKQGGIKLYLTQQVLRYRQAHAALFADGDYLPIETTGKQAEHLCAYGRVAEDEAVVVVAPRLLHRHISSGGWPITSAGSDLWQATTLELPAALAAPGSRFRDVLSGQIVIAVEQDGSTVVPVDEVFAHLPLALLERIDDTRRTAI
jgi:(1->4)-alpha-D-glucan 1-alpha-D-glucosylmutase